MIIGVTGHRPHKLFKTEPYTEHSRKMLVHFATCALKAQKPEKIITGMALGWDQAIAEACIDLGIPFIAAVPCHDYDIKWWHASKAFYRAMLERAEEVVTVKDGPYDVQCLHKRNIWVVDHSDKILALHNGQLSGTFNCIQYANSIKKPIQNVWQQWLDYRDGQRKLL